MYIIRQARGAQDSVFSFGQSKAKRFNKDISKIIMKIMPSISKLIWVGLVLLIISGILSGANLRKES